MGSSLDRLMRPGLQALSPYHPIAYPGDLDGVIKLDGNENVYGCSPRVREALASFSFHHVYPDPDALRLREELARYTGLPKEHIVAGSGSDELIDLVLRLVMDPGDRAISCGPTFGLYSVATQSACGVMVDIPRREDFTVDISAVLDSVDSRTKVVFMASPNNPTGTPMSRRDIERLLQTQALVVVDEAYYEFCGSTVADLVPAHDNLVVLRTFSKWAGLAGLRVGYGIFPEQIADWLVRIKTPYNVNAMAQLAAIESLRDLDYMMSTVGWILEERDRLGVMLANLDFMDPVPSDGNFILSRVAGRDALAIQQDLRAKGILIRHFDMEPIRDALRISVGKPEHTEALIWELRRWEEM